MIEQVVAKWHLYIRGQLEDGLDVLLADECVFFSPIVFTPQVGKDITKLYLQAASQTLPGDKKSESGDSSSTEGKFRYVKEVMSGNTAVLEFETTVEGKYANGVDIITCNDDGQIVEFKVMFRPLQAINAVHRQMGAMLEKMAPK